MTGIFRRNCLTLILGVTAITATVTAEDWPNFRGPRYDGISTETAFRKARTEPLKMVWERDIGSAFSSFAVVGDRLYTCGMGEGKQVLYCLNAATGDVIWKRPFEDEFRNSHGDGTRATPTINDGRIYVLGAHGRLVCADATTGKEIWDRKFVHPPTWAYSGSVLIEGDLAIASAGQDDGALIALNKKTGEVVWKSGSDPVGYAMPYPFTFSGKRYIVGFMGNSAVIVNASDGSEVWRTAWQTSWDVNAAMPIFHDGHLLLTSGYRTGAALYKLNTSGDKLSADEVWRSDVLLNKFQSCVLHEGNLYVSDQKALKCVDFMTGNLRWSEPRVKHGPLMLADGHLILLTEGGQLRIGKADPSGFNPTTTADVLTGRCWAVPILHDGHLYARNLDRVVCFDLR